MTHPYEQLTEAEAQALAALIDRAGLCCVVGSLALICEDKIEQAGKDQRIAAPWREASVILTRAEAALIREDIR